MKGVYDRSALGPRQLEVLRRIARGEPFAELGLGRNAWDVEAIVSRLEQRKLVRREGSKLSATDKGMKEAT